MIEFLRSTLLRLFLLLASPGTCPLCTLMILCATGKPSHVVGAAPGHSSSRKLCSWVPRLHFLVSHWCIHARIHETGKTACRGGEEPFNPARTISDRRAGQNVIRCLRSTLPRLYVLLASLGTSRLCIPNTLCAQLGNRHILWGRTRPFSLPEAVFVGPKAVFARTCHPIHGVKMAGENPQLGGQTGGQTDMSPCVPDDF